MLGQVWLPPPLDVKAQQPGLVAIVSLYYGEEFCSVQIRTILDGKDRFGPTMPCPGGLVVTEIVSQGEVSQAVADIEASSALQNGDSGGDGATQVRTIQLSGDGSADSSAIEQATNDLHGDAAAASGISPEDLDVPEAPAFMAPGALGEFVPANSDPSALPAAAGCSDGRVNQEKRAGITWNHDRIGVTLRSNVWYKRVSCANWKITEIETKLLATNYPRRIWMKDFEYSKAWSASQSRYVHTVFDLGCTRVYEGQWTTIRPGQLIQGGGEFQLESIDTNPRAPSTQVSCWWEEGTSAVSDWTYLPGGTR